MSVNRQNFCLHTRNIKKKKLVTVLTLYPMGGNSYVYYFLLFLPLLFFFLTFYLRRLVSKFSNILLLPLANNITGNFFFFCSPKNNYNYIQPKEWYFGIGFGEKNIATSEPWNARLTQCTCPIFVKTSGAYVRVHV
jgi:hypothetical protein